MLSLTQSAPYPSWGFGHSAYPGSCLAPLRRYAFTFSPYRYGSFPSTIPHSIRSAAAPVTKGAAKDVPVNSPYPPPGTGALIRTPGAARSGFGTPLPSYPSDAPLPEKSAYEKLSPSYAAAVMTRAAVDGIVRVVLPGPEATSDTCRQQCSLA